MVSHRSRAQWDCDDGEMLLKFWRKIIPNMEFYAHPQYFQTCKISKAFTFHSFSRIYRRMHSITMTVKQEREKALDYRKQELTQELSGSGHHSGWQLSPKKSANLYRSSLSEGEGMLRAITPRRPLPLYQLCNLWTECPEPSTTCWWSSHSTWQVHHAPAYSGGLAEGYKEHRAAHSTWPHSRCPPSAWPTDRCLSVLS